jgi:hypothetical protein
LGLFLAAALSPPGNALAWHSRTHTFMAQKAGLPNPEFSNFADLSREENKALLGPFHYHNAAPHATVTPAYIDRFSVREEEFVPADRKNAGPINIRVPHPAGVLYGKIVDLYSAMKGKSGWEYAYCALMIAHYIGDLSQPLHNIVHGDRRAGDGRTYPALGAWAKENHTAFDAVLESFFPLDRTMDAFFDAQAVSISVASADDLKREIAKIANASLALANRCYAEKRLLTAEEALKQTALSVSLLKAVLADTRRTF